MIPFDNSVNQPPAVSSDLESPLASLAAAALRHAARSPRERAELAAATARSVAATTDAWAEIAAAIKSRPRAAATGQGMEPPPAGGTPESLAEELATGPLATVRLLKLTASALQRIDHDELPWSGPLRIVHPTTGDERTSRVEVPVLPAPGLFDGTIFGGFSAAVRCGNPGGLDRFRAVWREEVRSRPAGGGVAVVLGAGNVTGLAAADAICQVFEHGRAAYVKLHPLHEPLAATLARALSPLVESGMIAIAVGGPDVAARAITSPLVTHVHLTGGTAAFEAIAASCSKPISCELGSVTPWIIVPGEYSPRELAYQADMVAGSIINNASFNCIATKLVVTSRSWRQREAFLDRIRLRLGQTPPRPAWFPGAASGWETLAERPAPADGTLPWLFRTGLDREAERHWLDREWFLPACAEIAIQADSMEQFCVNASNLAGSLPGSLAASVTMPGRGDVRDLRRAEALIEHLAFGVVAVNCWSAIAYAMGAVPWGGFPGATRAAPKSGIGFVHDPLLLPLVQNSIIRGPLVSRLMPPFLPWHPRAAALSREVVRLYDGGGLLSIARMLPNLRVAW
jgi:acyl-CoA reductase-like NAD-dependent aldehyde dehydrogenase